MWEVIQLAIELPAMLLKKMPLAVQRQMFASPSWDEIVSDSWGSFCLSAAGLWRSQRPGWG